jgi:hypothetical protein
VFTLREQQAGMNIVRNYAIAWANQRPPAFRPLARFFLKRLQGKPLNVCRQERGRRLNTCN